MNVQWIRIYSAYSEIMTSHMLHGLAGRQQMLLHIQYGRMDIMETILIV